MLTFTFSATFYMYKHHACLLHERMYTYTVVHWCTQVLSIVQITYLLCMCQKCTSTHVDKYTHSQTDMLHMSALCTQTAMYVLTHTYTHTHTHTHTLPAAFQTGNDVPLPSWPPSSPHIPSESFTTVQQLLNYCTCTYWPPSSPHIPSESFTTLQQLFNYCTCTYDHGFQYYSVLKVLMQI